MSSRLTTYALLAGIVAFLAGTAAPTAIVTITYTGVTSQPASLLYQNWIGGYSQTELLPPVSGDVVSGSFVLDTAKLPLPDADELPYGHVLYTTELRPGFVSGTFTSSGYVPAAATDGSYLSRLSFSPAGPYGELASANGVGQDLGSTGTDAQGNAIVRYGSDTTYTATSLAWYEPLPLIDIGGVLIPDFTQIKDGAFASSFFRPRNLTEEIRAGSPDGPGLSRTALIWEQFTGGSAGALTSISMTVSGVPEPGAWATLILGFGLIGGTLRRERRRGAAAG